MMTYISILRGINLGGHKTIKMEALKKMLSQLGFAAIHTYIQSGNIVYQYKKTDTKKLDFLIKEQIETVFGFDVPVITITINEFKKIRNSNPFLKDKLKEESFLHVSFLADKPASENLNKIIAVNYLPDEFKIIDKAVYLFCPNGYGKTKLSNTFFENKLKVNATTRNWKTTNELISMADTQV